MREKEGTSLNDLKKRLGALVLAGWMTLSLAACSVPLGDAEIRTGEDGTLVVDGEAIWDEAAPDGETETPAEEPALTEDTGTLYEYYSTREELLAGIREGYVFCLITPLKRRPGPPSPAATGPSGCPVRIPWIWRSASATCSPWKTRAWSPARAGWRYA